LTESNVRIASSREVATAGANAPITFGRENNTKPKHEKRKNGISRDISTPGRVQVPATPH
jgi:hypothetical protein